MYILIFDVNSCINKDISSLNHLPFSQLIQLSELSIIYNTYNGEKKHPGTHRQRWRKWTLRKEE